MSRQAKAYRTSEIGNQQLESQLTEHHGNTHTRRSIRTPKLGIALLFDWRGAVGVLHRRSSSNESGSVGSVAIRVMALPMAGGVNQ